MGDLERWADVAIPDQEPGCGGVGDTAENDEAKRPQHEPVPAPVETSRKRSRETRNDEPENAGKQKGRVQQKAERHDRPQLTT